MDAENAGVPADLENGGGGAVAVTIEMEPCPADRGLREKQLFTWLGELPYIVAVVVGTVLSAVGVVMASITDMEAKQEGQAIGYWALALIQIGPMLVLFGVVAGAEQGWWEREDLLRFEAD
jgi:hypothetical protein